MQTIKKYGKTLAAACLALTLCLIFLPTGAKAAVVDSGTCGDNLTWTLDDAGTLTISGTGAMEDFIAWESSPWESWLVKNIVIPDGVTSIGNQAFGGTNIKNVTIPDSVTSIGEMAFGYTTLTSVTIPDSVTSIGDYAFYYCNSLTSVVIGNGVTSIGNSAFELCENLVSVTIPATVTRIGNGAFADCNALTDVYYAGTQEDWDAVSVEATLVYTADFRGTDGKYAPSGISGNYAGYTYTPSEDGKELTVIGNAYSGSNPDGTMGASYWGGVINGLPATSANSYTMTYKVRNNSTKANSQVGFGGWIIDQSDLTKFWNVTSTYNSTAASVLSLMNGNGGTGGLVAANADGKANVRAADKDEDGYEEIKVHYDGTSGKMYAYTKLDGAWTLLVSRSITVNANGAMGLLFYTYRTGAINLSVRDVEIYAPVELPASATLHVHHTWGEWIVDTEPTQEADGTWHRTCSACGEREDAVCTYTDYYNYDFASKITLIAKSSMTATSPAIASIKADDYSRYGLRIDCPLPRAAASGTWTYDIKVKRSDGVVICEESGLDIAQPRPTSSGNMTVRLYGGLRSDEYYLNGDYSLYVTFHFSDGNGIVRYYDDCVAATGSSATYEPFSGKCGDNLSWALDGEGTLMISGTGAMTSYLSASNVPWYSQRAKIKTVVIENGATTIANYAFSNCVSLTSVDIPDGVTSIGNSAFNACTALTDVYYTGTQEAWDAITIDLNNASLTYVTLHLIQQLKITGASLTLCDSIAINYRVSAALFEENGGDYSNPYMVFVLDGVERRVDAHRTVGGYYVFDFTDIAPQMVRMTVSATLYAANNGTLHTSATREYGVETYCNNMLAKYTGEEHAAFRRLLNAVLEYGDAAYAYAHG